MTDITSKKFLIKIIHDTFYMIFVNIYKSYILYTLYKFYKHDIINDMKTFIILQT